MAVALNAVGLMQWFCRILHRLAIGVLALAAIAAGVLVYLAMLSPALQHTLEQFAARAFTVYTVPLHLTATLLLLLVLIIAWTSLYLHRLHSRALLINTTEGSVRISAPMLSRFIKHVVQGCDGVRSVRVQTIPDRRKMTVIASVTVCGQTPVSIIAGRLQHHVRQRVVDVFGVDLLRDIRVDIAGVATDDNAPRGLLPWRAAQSPAPPSEPHADAAPVLVSS